MTTYSVTKKFLGLSLDQIISTLQNMDQDPMTAVVYILFLTRGGAEVTREEIIADGLEWCLGHGEPTWESVLEWVEREKPLLEIGLMASRRALK